MAGFNTLIWNTKDSARAEYPPIEKADEKHKRDLSENEGSCPVSEKLATQAKTEIPRFARDDSFDFSGRQS
jgi:hypothetical protein